LGLVLQLFWGFSQLYNGVRQPHPKRQYCGQRESEAFGIIVEFSFLNMPHWLLVLSFQFSEDWL